MPLKLWNLHFGGMSERSTLSMTLANHAPVEYATQRELFHAQPLSVRSVLEIHASLIIKAILNSNHDVDITLPNQVAWKSVDKKHTMRLPIPLSVRAQSIKAKNQSLTFNDLNRFFDRSEHSTELALTVYSFLLRHSIALHLISNVQLPAYGDKPTTENCPPQWSTLNDQNEQLLDAVANVQSQVNSLKQSLIILEAASKIAPYVTQDKSYRQKFSEISNLLTLLGRDLARCHLDQVIETINKRASTNSLNRGITLTLLYFDDQKMEMKPYHFEVIPKGRILFEPTYVWWAARNEQVKVSNNNSLPPSTRNHLIAELKSLEEAFETPELARCAELSFQQKNPFKDFLRDIRLVFNTITMKTFTK